MLKVMILQVMVLKMMVVQVMVVQVQRFSYLGGVELHPLLVAQKISWKIWKFEIQSPDLGSFHFVSTEKNNNDDLG